MFTDTVNKKSLIAKQWEKENFIIAIQTHSLLLSTLSEQNWTDCDQY